MPHAAQRLLIVFDEEGDPTALVHRYLAAGYEVETARGVGATCTILRQQEFAVMLADMSAADDATLAVLRAARRTRPAPAVILLLPRVSPDSPLVLALARQVAYVCLRHPLDEPELDSLVGAACIAVGRERLEVRPASALRGVRDIARWEQAQEALEDALVAVATLGPGVTQEQAAEAAGEIARRLQVERHPSLDAVAMEALARALHDWATRALPGHRAA
ncbi:MAG: hypothetical protein WC273_02950 [Dehalococcoidia bacterium]